MIVMMMMMMMMLVVVVVVMMMMMMMMMMMSILSLLSAYIVDNNDNDEEDDKCSYLSPSKCIPVRNREFRVGIVEKPTDITNYPVCQSYTATYITHLSFLRLKKNHMIWLYMLYDCLGPALCPVPA